jgi:putative glycosyltransferase (TIGR04372 family)
MISDVYRRPLLTVNFLPAIALWSWSNAVTAPKPLVWRDTGQRLTLDELFAANHYRSEEYSQRGIEVRDLSADSLRSIVEEAWLRVQDSWEDVPEDVRRNAEAWAALERHPEYANWHGYRHPHARFSTVWLRELESSLEKDAAPGGGH